MKYDVEIELDGSVESYAFSSVAKQSNGAAWLKCGDSVVLATVAIDESQSVSEDFLPLTVQYIEKSYAAGKIPGGFIKRETKPSDFETLTSRIVDRSLRPLFPKGYAHPTQITILVFSAGSDADLQLLALKAASAALYVSDVDINRSISGLRVAKVDGKVVFNPPLDELKNSTLDLFLSASKDDLLMIEMRSIGSDNIDTSLMADPMIDPTLTPMVLANHTSNGVSEDELIELLKSASEILFANNAKYEEAFKPFKKEIKPLVLNSDELDKTLYDYLKTGLIHYQQLFHK